MTDQGGANPSQDADHAYSASVQPVMSRRQDLALGSVASTSPESFTTFDVLIAWADDPLIRAIRIGDEIQWGEIILSVIAPANDSGGLGMVWHIKCEQVIS